MKFKFISGKFWIAIITVGCIALVLCYYLFVVVAHQEKELVEKGYRELTQIDKNLKDRMSSLTKNADFVAGCLSLDIIDSKWTAKKDSILIVKSLANFRERIRQLSLDTTYSIHHKVEDNDIDSGGYPFRRKNDWYLETTYNKIVENTYNKDFYEEFAIIQEYTDSVSKSVSDEKPCDPCKKPTRKSKGKTQRAKVLFQTFFNKIKLDTPDSLLRFSHGIQSGGLLDVVIDDETYKVFVYRTKFNDKEDWTLLGFMKSSTFGEKSHKLDHGLVFSIFLIMVVIVLALPILKLAVMSGAERLEASNVVSIGLSITVGVAVMTLIGLSMTDYLKSEMATQLNFKNNPKNKVRDMAKTLHDNFNHELDTVLDVLVNLKPDTVYMNAIEPRNIISSDTGTTFSYNSKGHVKFIKSGVVSTRKWQRKIFNQVIWINSDGELVLQRSFKPVRDFFIPPNLSERDYFRNVKAEKLWTHKKEKFYLQSINSWIDNESEAAVSIPLPNKKNDSLPICLAMATPLLCMKNAILSQGYSICIINSLGDVQFHSDQSKNLKENLKEETEQSSDLSACLNSRAADTFEANYLGNEHLFSVVPIEGTELFAVAYYDLEYYRMPVQIAIITAAIFILAMYFIAGVCMVLFFIASYRTTKLKIRPFFLQWLGPRTDINFLLCCTALAATNFCFCLLPFFVAREWVYLCFLIIPVHVIYFTFIFFDSNGKGFYLKNKTAKIFTCLMLLLLVVLGLVSQSIDSGSDLWLYCLANIVIFFSYLALYFAARWIIRGSVFQSYFPTNYTLRYYFLFLISWLLIASIVPTLCFYRIGLVNGSIMTARNDLIETSKKFSTHPETKNLQTGSPRNSLSAYAKNAGVLAAGTLLKKNTCTSKTEKLLTAPIVEITGFAKREKYYKFTHSYDSTWRSNYDKSKDTITTMYRGDDGKALISLRYGTENLSLFSYFNPLNISSIALHIVWFIAFIAFLYLLLRFVTKRVYGVDIFCENKTAPDSFISLKQRVDSSPKLFLVGLPQAGKEKSLKEIRDDGFREINWKSDSNKKVSALVDDDNSKVLFTHFEYGINNHEINQKKLKVLESLHHDANAKIIIASTVQPVAILDFYETMIDRALSKDKMDEAYTEIKSYRLAFRQWQNVLSSFITIYHPMLVTKLKGKLSYENLKIKRVVRAELEHGTLLPTLEPLVAQQHYSLCHKGEDDIILQIEILAESYYQAMWNSFTRKEKLLLYDLAKDHFVNTGNIKEIKILIQKGVIKMENSLQLMNKSFANFILSSMREDEELLMQQEMSQKGTWNTVQMVLILTLLGLAIFFTLAQQNLLQNFNTLLTVAGSVLALIARFGGIFGSKTKLKDT